MIAYFQFRNALFIVLLKYSPRDENGEMYDAVAGDFLVVGLGEEDFASLTPELAQKYEQLFHQPEAFLKLGNRLLVLPVPDEPPTEKPRTKPPAEHDR